VGELRDNVLLQRTAVISAAGGSRFSKLTWRRWNQGCRIYSRFFTLPN